MINDLNATHHPLAARSFPSSDTQGPRQPGPSGTTLRTYGRDTRATQSPGHSMPHAQANGERFKPSVIVSRTLFPGGHVSTAIRVETRQSNGTTLWAEVDKIPPGAMVLETTRHAF